MANYFFFQAEDGIRDTSVTGVQTCALPIFHADGHGRGVHGARSADTGFIPLTCLQKKDTLRHWQKVVDLLAIEPVRVGEAMRRSEERRVGKECRYRWARGH